ncbi:hypothetical protein ACIP5Y_42305 [Nocardia sp. NPDC088792]|uniref:hypothetical protein n=1 Tax=Nocardia sp. NPDC088792 TaxID=3364332 RepID=UPI0038002525
MASGAAAERPDAAARESNGEPAVSQQPVLPDRSTEYEALCADLYAQPLPPPPVLGAGSGSRPSIPLVDLVEAGAVAVHEAPSTIPAVGGEAPMLSAKDVRLGRAPSRRGDADVTGAVTVRSGDVLVAISAETSVRVCAFDGVLLGPGIRLVRAEPAHVDPRFLAGVLRAAVEASGGLPIDIYDVCLPRISLPEQRSYGAAFEQLTALEDAVQRQRVTIEQLVRSGFAGLSQGRLRPITGDR